MNEREVHKVLDTVSFKTNGTVYLVEKCESFKKIFYRGFVYANDRFVQVSFTDFMDMLLFRDIVQVIGKLESC